MACSARSRLTQFGSRSMLAKSSTQSGPTLLYRASTCMRDHEYTWSVAHSETPRSESSIPWVDRSTTGLNSGGFGGRSVDGRPAQRTRQDTVDELKHLAKVRAAGSNPLFRSIAAGQRRFFNPESGESSLAAERLAAHASFLLSSRAVLGSGGGTIAYLSRGR